MGRDTSKISKVLDKMKILYLSIIIVSVFFTLLLSSHVHAECTIVNGKQSCTGMNPILTSIRSNKLLYENSDKPVITITGVPNKLEYLEIYNQSGNIVFSHSIELPSTGIANYTLDISSYKPGIYSATATTASKVSTIFRVVQMPLGPIIVLNVMKDMYLPGDPITISGAEGPDEIIQLSLTDPNGTIVKSVQTFSDKAGLFWSSDLKIPTNAISGIWEISATRGLAHGSHEIKVNSSSTIVSTIKSPLKQFQSGIAAKDVQCNDGFILVIKAGDGSPACVSPNTSKILIERGWAKIIVTKATFDVIQSDTTQEKIPVTINGVNSGYSFNCTITGGQIEQARADIINKELVLSIKSTENGTLIADLPRKLIDAKMNGQDAQFIVLEDGKEALYKQIASTIQSRILNIPFQYGASQIEIIAPVPIR